MTYRTYKLKFYSRNRQHKCLIWEIKQLLINFMLETSLYAAEIRQHVVLMVVGKNTFVL